jgi:hypothetical protein
VATLDTRLSRLEQRLLPPEPPTIEIWRYSDLPGGYFCTTTGEELTAEEFERTHPDAFTLGIDRASSGRPLLAEADTDG